MKHEQVVPNYIIMLETSITLLALVGSGWLLIKLISACFWLPGYLKNWQFEELQDELKEKQKLLSEDAASESDAKEDFEKIPEVVDEEVNEDKKDK